MTDSQLASAPDNGGAAACSATAHSGTSFETGLLQLGPADTSATLTGRTNDQVAIEGSDSVQVVAP